MDKEGIQRKYYYVIGRILNVDIKEAKNVDFLEGDIMSGKGKRGGKIPILST